VTLRSLGSVAELTDGGTGICFELAPGVAGFAIRWAGEIHAWINRCPHRGTRLDWEPGEFFDEDRRLLACASHGALFEPDSGLCVAGPCRGASLMRILVSEIDGQLHTSPGV
jgi:nitrite reductase/ring-hydroxylating ferredoxin subunit